MPLAATVTDDLLLKLWWRLVTLMLAVDLNPTSTKPGCLHTPSMMLPPQANQQRGAGSTHMDCPGALHGLKHAVLTLHAGASTRPIKLQRWMIGVDSAVVTTQVLQE
jgi:hypothetical protein